VILRIVGGVTDARLRLGSGMAKVGFLGTSGDSGDDVRDLVPVRPFRLPEPIHHVPPFADMPIHHPSKNGMGLRASNVRHFGFQQIELACQR
jgi:hypothetical protein